MTTATPGTEVDARPIGVLIADGEPVVRAGLGRVLAERGFAVVAEVADSGSALAAAERLRPDLCLVDVALSGNGLSTVAQIASRVPATTIVALAAVASPTEMISALERGAVGYLLKEIGADELATTLRRALAGEPALARSLVPYLIDHVRSGSQRRLTLPAGAVSLTPREWDVAGLMQEGLRTEEIGRQLGLSTVTVRRHISSLLRKSGASSRADLVETLRLYAHG